MRNPYFDLIKTVWYYGKPWRSAIIVYYIAFIIAQFFLSLGPYAFGQTINLLQHFTPGALSQVIFWLVMGIVFWLLFWLFHGPARVKERDIALKIQQKLRITIYEKLTHLPLKWHQNHHSGNIISRINRASTALFRFAGDQFIYIETIIKFLVSSIFLFWLSWSVGLFSLLTCAFAIGMVLLFDRILIPLYENQNENDNYVNAVFFDYISNITTILTLRLGELTRNNLFQHMMKFWPFYKKDIVINEVKWFFMGMVLTTFQSLILIFYILYSLHATGTVLIGTVVMIFRYQTDLSDVFYNFSAHYSELVRMNTDVNGLQPLIKDIEKFAHTPQGEAVARQWHHIQLSELDFHHVGHQTKHQFKHLALNIKRGEKIALIGASGGGKSTLLNIIRGLYVPEQVKLSIDNNVFNTLEPLQAITTLIPQDPEIFENTIQFNITLDVETTDEAIHNAIQLAGFNQVLNTLPAGLNTDIREKGLNLSVGQKQRLALARGLFAARFSSLILMDEPTSSVDLMTEKEILSRVISAFSEATIIVSLHRLHLLPQFDRVIMLDQGCIVADGFTARLLKTPGPVHDLYYQYQGAKKE